MNDVSLVWFRHDLRLADQPALLAAVARGRPVVPVFIWAPEEEGRWPPGAASRWWLHQALTQLAAGLRERGSRLLLRRGPTLDALRTLVAETGASAVYWNRRYEPAAVERDRRIEAALRGDGVLAESSNGSLLFEPWSVLTGNGKPYQVFTAFWRRCVERWEPDTPRPAPTSLPAPSRWPGSVALRELGLEPTIDWAGGLRATWQPGETGACRVLERFLAEELAEYAHGRDRPAQYRTSRLSPHLRFGAISPRQVWAAVSRQASAEARQVFLRELGWREFAYHLLYHFPQTPEQPLRSKFARFPWASANANLRAWQRGCMGYPLVDAGMHELWHTGWMHNRVRMVVASFLTKHLLVPWQAGAAWFWDTLVDADLANNTLGWQWTAGCGADAAPYFRIFNPVNQGEKFDPDGAYVRRWVPELARMPNRWIHKPWEAPPAVLSEAGVALGSTYPRPVIEHHAARARALAAWRQINR